MVTDIMLTHTLARGRRGEGPEPCNGCIMSYVVLGSSPRTKRSFGPKLFVSDDQGGNEGFTARDEVSPFPMTEPRPT